MVINCNSLKSCKKQADFKAAVTNHNPDIILGCESKIDEDIATYSFIQPNYTVYRKDRNQNGGGVFIAVKDTLISSNVDVNSDGEIIWATLQFAHSKPLFIASYYGPQKNKEQAVDNLAKSLSKILSQQRSRLPNIIIGGDFNFGDIDWKTWTTTNPKTAKAHQYFIDWLVENSLAQLVEEVTRPASQSTLDLITTTNPNLVSDIEVSHGISDHDIVTFNINMKPKYHGKPKRKIYQFHKADPELLKQQAEVLTQEFLDSKPQNNSVNSNWETIKTRLLKIMEDHVPHKMSSGKRNLPWIDTTLKRQMRKRDKLHSKAKKVRDSSTSWRHFRQYRNKVTKLVRNAHNNYVNTVIGGSLASENPKSFWSYVKQMRTENIGIPTLSTKSRLCTTDKTKAEALNTQFKSVFTKESLNDIPDKGESPHPSIKSLTIGVEGVEKQLSKLNPSKACGPDEIPASLL